MRVSQDCRQEARQRGDNEEVVGLKEERLTQKERGKSQKSKKIVTERDEEKIGGGTNKTRRVNEKAKMRD